MKRKEDALTFRLFHERSAQERPSLDRGGTSVVEKWKETSRRTLVSTHVFELEERRTVNPRNNNELPFYVFESPHWVNVIPLLDDRRVLMVRQFRQGTREITLEIPGGMVDPGEEPEVGARRELLEETGYEAETLELIGVVDTNPAIQSNKTYTFLARGLRHVAEQSQDQAEDIEITEVEIDQLDRLVADGTITHSLVIAAFYWLDRSRDVSKKMESAIEELSSGQLDKVAALAKRINARLTPEDLRNPQDFPELAEDSDFNYQDGMLAGLDSARMALRRLAREI